MRASLAQTLESINQICSKSVRSLNGMAMNIAYNARHSACPWLQRKPIVLEWNGEPAYLLGKKYTKNNN